MANRDVTSRMSLDTVADICRFVFDDGPLSDQLTFVWHAGEPLVLPISFYEKALDLIEDHCPPSVEIRHSIQTNGTLLSQEWCDFIKDRHISIGVSIDGPAEIHDVSRLDRSGRGTFARTMAGIGLLRDNAIPFGIIAVLTARSIAQPDLLWHFFQAIGASSIAFNAEEIEGIHRVSSLNRDTAVAQYRAFFSSLLEHRDFTKSELPIRELDASLQHVLRGSLPPRNAENTLGAVLAFDWRGRVMTFSPELLTQSHPVYGTMAFGVASRHELLRQPRFLEIATEVQRGIKLCRGTCEYFHVCGGGAPSNKLAEHGTFCATETLHCRLRIKTTVELLLDELDATPDSPGCEGVPRYA